MRVVLPDAVLCCVATKALNRGLLGLVVLAADCYPIEIVMHLPDRHAPAAHRRRPSVPYVFVRSKTGTAPFVTRTQRPGALLLTH